MVPNCHKPVGQQMDSVKSLHQKHNFQNIEISNTVHSGVTHSHPMGPGVFYSFDKLYTLRPDVPSALHWTGDPPSAPWRATGPGLNTHHQKILCLSCVDGRIPKMPPCCVHLGSHHSVVSAH